MKTAKKTLSQAREDLLAAERFSNCTLFHTHAWLDIMARTSGKAIDIYTFNDRKKPVGISWLVPLKAGISMSPIFDTETAYGGVVGDDVPMLLRALKDQTSFIVVQNTTAEVPGFIQDDKCTVITALDAPDADTHLKRMRKGHRYNIGKSLANPELEVGEHYDDHAIAEYQELLRRTHRRIGIPDPPMDLYKEVILRYCKKGQGMFLVCRHQDKPVAGIVTLTYKDTMYFWTGASDETAQHLYANDLLQWHAIQWAYRKKLRAYDMLGADIEGVRKFKMGFGGELVTYRRIYSDRKTHLLAKAYRACGGILQKAARVIR
ncbi:MAG: GNAT family N-acetyltransferase [Nanoarchaeota archaeon]